MRTRVSMGFQFRVGRDFRQNAPVSGDASRSAYVTVVRSGASAVRPAEVLRAARGAVGFSLPVGPGGRGATVAPPELPRHSMRLLSCTRRRRPTACPHSSDCCVAVASVDIDADGRLDLVATGRGGLRTFLNIGSGRFVEHSATRTILRHHSAPGFTARERSTHTEVAALVGERQALAPTLRTAERATVCTFTLDAQSAPIADVAIVAGGSRAPPSSLS